MRYRIAVVLLAAVGLSGCVMGAGPGNYVSSAVYSEGPAGDMRLESVTLGVTTSTPTVYVVQRDPYWRERAEQEREREWREHRLRAEAGESSGPRITIIRPGKIQELR